MKTIKRPDIKKIRNQPANFGMLDDAAHAILEGVQKLFDKLDSKIDYVHNDLKHEIKEVKYDTPSIKDFNELKSRVDVYHPA